MRKMLLIIIFSFLISHNVYPAENNDMRYFKEAKSPSGVTVKVSAPKDNYHVQEPVELQFEISNNSKEEIIYSSATLLDMAIINIRDTVNKKDIPLTLFGKRMENPAHISLHADFIKPSSSYKFKYPLSRMFDLSLSSQYEIECEVRYIDKSNNKIILKTPPLELFIDEKPYK